MIIPIQCKSMREAEELCALCRQAEGDLVLRAGRYCVDPRLTMGILAMMYTEPDKMALDTEDMDPAEAEKLRQAMEKYRRED